MNKKIKGITLIALIITIIVLLILAGVTIHMIFGDSGLFAKANEAKFKTMMSGYRDDVNLYTSWKVTETMNTDTSGINSGEPLKSAIEQEVVLDITADDVNIAITDIIKDIKKEAKEYVAVYKGEICYVANDELSNNANQEKWCNDLGIKVLKVEKQEGIVVRNGNYELVDGIYVCTPKLNEGFNAKRTRYLELNDQGNLTPKNWVDQKPTDNWYSYRQNKWANIIVEDNGTEIYYTWIPRYCFTLDQTNQKSTVKFLSETSSEVPSGYQIPEAFTFDGKQLSGYWAMKYTAGDETAPTFETEVVSTSGSIKTKGITGSKVASGQVYKYYINGEYKGEKTSANDWFEYTGLSANTKYTILIEIRNSSDEYIGTISKQITTIDANKPDLTGFAADCTYYVEYDENENEKIGDKIKNDGSNAPKDWYDYSSSKWANIVVKADGKTTYYTWIPRYEFLITGAQQAQIASARTEVRFLKDTSTDTSSGYKIPEAFTFDGKELSGYWAMKYTAGD